MPPRAVFRPLCCLIFGHAPVVEVNEAENSSAYVCERCRAPLGDFVTNLRKPRAEPAAGAAFGLAHPSSLPGPPPLPRPLTPRKGAALMRGRLSAGITLSALCLLAAQAVVPAPAAG